MRRERAQVRYLFGGVGIVLAAFAAIAIDCGMARAASPDSSGGVWFQQHKPNYLTTYYSNEAADSNSPWLELQVSLRFALMSAIGDANKLTIPYFPDGAPILAFTLHAWWAVADSSSPFAELDWNPQVYYSMFDDSGIPVWKGIEFDGLNVGWEHVSTGVSGVDSRGWDRAVAEGQLDWRAFTVYLRPWWTFNYDTFTEDIASVVNIKGTDFGGEAIVKLVTDQFAAAVTIGNSYQDYELTVPLRDLWNVALYGQLHQGYSQSLVTYAEKVTSGGAGIILKR